MASVVASVAVAVADHLRTVVTLGLPVVIMIANRVHPPEQA